MTTHSFKPGDFIHGFCCGSFGLYSYACLRVEAVGPDWIVTRNDLRAGGASGIELAAGFYLPTPDEAADKSYCDVDCDGPDLTHPGAAYRTRLPQSILDEGSNPSEAREGR